MDSYKYPITKKDQSIILGTLHPRTAKSFVPIVDFFYGHDYGLWDIFRINFNIDLYSKKQLMDDVSLVPEGIKKIKSFLKKYHITVSDQVLECDKTDIQECHESLNMDLLLQIENSNLQQIFFTSMETYKYFCNMINSLSLYRKIQQKGYLNGNQINLILSNQKKVKGIILISPSSSGVRSIPSQLKRVTKGSPWYDIAQRYLRLRDNHINSKGLCAEIRDQYYRLAFRSIIN